MQGPEVFDELRKKDPRYSPEAYQFVMDALAYTVKQVGERRHVTGRELLFGARDFAVDCWGLMARQVLNSWGLTRTDDVGEIVFHMIDVGLLSKTERDSLDDFKGVYSFAEAFERSYAPQLDEHGHIRRKLPYVPRDEQVKWITFFGETTFN